MEDGVEQPSSDEGESSFGDYLDKLCVYYMSIGMTYEEFWFGDYGKLRYINEAYERQVRHENEMLWLSGIYTTNALGVVLGNAFRKKGSKPLEYMKEPLPIFDKTEEEKELKRKKEEQKIIAQLDKLKEKFNGSHKPLNTS